MKCFRKWILLSWLALGAAALPASGQSGDEPQALLQKTLGAVLQNDFAALMTVCDDDMKSVVTPDMLEDLHRRLLLRFRTGYSPTYMGYLNKQGAQVHYWKLVLKDRGDDVLMTLVLRKGRVSALNLSGYTTKN